jgi:hypothetical protein
MDGVLNTSLPIRTGWQILIEPNRYAARFQVVGQLEDKFDVFPGVADEHVIAHGQKLLSRAVIECYIYDPQALSTFSGDVGSTETGGRVERASENDGCATPAQRDTDAVE